MTLLPGGLSVLFEPRINNWLERIQFGTGPGSLEGVFKRIGALNGLADRLPRDAQLPGNFPLRKSFDKNQSANTFDIVHWKHLLNPPGELTEEINLQSTNQQSILHQVVPFSIADWFPFRLPKWFPFQLPFPTGVLYGVTGGISPTDAKWLVSIDPTTARVTAIGALNTSNDKPLADITFSGGTLYGANAASGALYTVDTTTGASTRISSSNDAITTGSAGHGLAAQGGTLFTSPDGVYESLYTYDATTGAGTIVTGLSGAPLNGAINALAFDGALPTLYGVNNNESNPSHTHLVTIDTTTGVITDIGASVNNLDAIAFAVVPEPSTLVSLVAGLAGVLGYIARRRSIA